MTLSSGERGAEPTSGCKGRARFAASVGLRDPPAWGTHGCAFASPPAILRVDPPHRSLAHHAAPHAYTIDHPGPSAPHRPRGLSDGGVRPKHATHRHRGAAIA